MTIIQVLESRGVQRLELRIISRCWQLNIEPPIIAKIMGRSFSVDDIEGVIAYLKAQEENDKLDEIKALEFQEIINEFIEEGIEEGIEKGMKVIKLWQQGVELPMIANMLDLPLERIEKVIADFQSNAQNWR